MKTINHAQFGERAPLWVKFAWILVISFALIQLSPKYIEASHYSATDPRHQAKIHYSGASHDVNTDEDYCVKSDTANMSDWSLLNRVSDTFSNSDPHWNGHGNYRIDLYVANNLWCDATDLNTVEVEIYAADNYVGICGDDNIACVNHDILSWDANYGHNHYNKEFMYLDIHVIDSSQYEYRKTINHEMGHVIGLRDPAYKGHCDASITPSIMHLEYYGCSYPYSYPSQKDFDSVIGVMNGQ